MGTAAMHESCVLLLLTEHGSPWFQGMLLHRQQEDEASCSRGHLWGSCTAAFLDCTFQQW